MKYCASILAACGMVTLVSAHGYVTSPKARQPGTAFAEKCGKQLLSQQSSDIKGNIQGMIQITANQNDFNADECNLWVCKGFQFEDNQDNVQSFAAGTVVPIAVNIAAPHTGTANVTIVDAKTGEALSGALKSWDEYASNSRPITDDEKNFEITVPDLGGKCTTAGDCVIQWIWDAHSISQTYEACIDFTQGGSSNGSPANSSPKPSTTAQPTARPASADRTLSTVYVTSTAAAVACSARKQNYV